MKGKGWKAHRTEKGKKAVRKVIGERYTIDDVIEANKTGGGHFFDHENLKHHGETKKDFKVFREDGAYMVESKKGIVYRFNPLSGSLTYVRGS